MKVKDLIALLQAEDQDKTVLVCDEDNQMNEIESKLEKWDRYGHTVVVINVFPI